MGKKMLIDRDGYVITHLDEIPVGLFYVTGVDPLVHTEGRILATRRASQLDDLLTITKAIEEAGYQNLFTEINVSDENDLRLVTNTEMIVSFYTTDSISKTLELAKGVMDKGNIGGRLKISGNFADYKPLSNVYSTTD